MVEGGGVWGGGCWGWVKLLATMAGRRRKIKKKKNTRKKPLELPPKTKFGSKYKWFKIPYLEFFFENIISDMQRFYIRPHIPLNIIRDFFLIFKFSRSKSPFWLCKFSSKHVSVSCQKKNHLHCTISWRPRTTFLMHFESKCLYISVYVRKKIFVSKT